VTLEPCSHQGRTGPCSEAILEAGIAHVFVGHRDPNPAVRGHGLRRLRARGVTVEEGVLADDCRAQHRGFISVQERGRPFVALKLAATLDGRIATARGESRWITGAAAREAVHGLRAQADAVMVGSTTARADDPCLTARRRGRLVRCPVRVLVDSGLRVPARAGLYRDEHARRTWVLTGSRPAPAARRARERAGSRLIEVPRRGAHLDLAKGLARLAEHGLTDILVEGGGGLAAALLRAGLVDELHWFAAPSLLGGDARGSLGPLGLARLADRVELLEPRVRRLGEDLYVHGRVRSQTRSGQRARSRP